MEKKRGQPLQTAVRAGQALTCFSDREPELGVTHLAKLLGVSPSTAYRILAGLELAGLVEQDPNTRRYRLSWLLFILGNAVLHRIGIGGQADAAMRALANACGETVNLGVQSGGTVIYVRKIESSEMLRADTQIGSRVPLHCTAIGKVLLAYLEEQERKAILGQSPLERYTSRTIVDPATLNHELETIRARNLATDKEEFQDGVYGMACPIRDRQDNVVAGLSLGAPARRLPAERMLELEQPLREAADAISRSLGYPPRSLLASAPAGIGSKRANQS